ncbi:catalytic [Ascochyta rabiei]|uniref:Dolichyldiphosphatase n=1 Tax=Didymella rabiei TaxID=5454 RepID=A0A163JZI9_DIDRA|nr:catalytic [Ascochyta rabiei]
MENPPLASLSLTHVHYNPADRLSYLCAWLALVPQGLCVVYATLIWSNREIEIGLMFAGQMACEALNWVLKRHFKEERPRGRHSHVRVSPPGRQPTSQDSTLTSAEMHGKGYGMPSSHAQFVAFFSVTLTLFLLFRHVPHPTETHTPFSFAGRFVLSLLAMASAAAVAVSRIYLSYHTQKQVFVGCACGALFAILWFVFTTYLRRAGWIEWALSTWLARAFRVRDLVIQEDLVDSGWARWEERRKRQDFRVQGKKSR